MPYLWHVAKQNEEKLNKMHTRKSAELKKQSCRMVPNLDIDYACFSSLLFFINTQSVYAD